jgi:type I restriction enzyme S subunit
MSIWNTTNLSDTKSFEYLNGLWTGKKPPFERAVVIRNTNFRDDGVLDLSDVALLDVESKKLVSRRLRKGDIIIERSGGGPKQPVGRVCFFYREDNRSYSFSNFTSTLRVKDTDSFLPLFVHYYLLYLYNSGFTIPLQRATTGIRNLDFSAYQEAKIPKPPKSEQERIVAVLWNLQCAIETEKKLIAASKELKVSTLRQLFSRGLRGEAEKETDIGTVPSNWKPTHIADFGEVVTGTTPKTAQRRFYDGGTFPFIAPGDMGKTTRIYHSEKFLTEEGLAESRVLPRNTVCFVCIGSTIGKIGITTKDRSATNQQINAIVVNERFDPLYVCYLLTRWANHVSSFASPSPVPIMSKGKFQQILLYASPDKEEQSEIAHIISKIDAKIEIHECRQSTMQNLFKGLLDQLMSGHIRVGDLEIAFSELAP